jgi:hypothetical protein
MLDDEFNKRQANLIRDLACRADPFIKKRLLDLANRYDRPRTRPIPLPMINEQDHSDHNNGDSE